MYWPRRWKVCYVVTDIREQAFAMYADFNAAVCLLLLCCLVAVFVLFMFLFLMMFFLLLGEGPLYLYPYEDWGTR